MLEQCPEEGGRRGMSIQGPESSEHNTPLLPISTYIEKAALFFFLISSNTGHIPHLFPSPRRGLVRQAALTVSLKTISVPSEKVWV